MDNGIMEKFRREVYVADDGYAMPYRLYIPDNYDCGEKYPLVLFLNGAGERGDDNEKQLSIGLKHMFQWEDSPAYNAIIVAPQCPCDRRWVDVDWEKGVFNRKELKETKELKTALAIMNEVIDFCNVDEDRVYVTGISMGGYGTFDMLARHGSRFAAGVAVCGGCDPNTDARPLTRMPLWIFHGSADTCVPPIGSRLMYAQIRNAGGTKVRYTEYSGMNHGIWDNAYSDREMVEWLFQQSRYERRMLAEKRKKQKKVAAIVAGGVGIAAAAAAVVAGTMHAKNAAKEKAEPAAAAPALPRTTVVTETVVQAPVAEPETEETAVVVSAAPAAVKPLKNIKLPKASRTKAVMDKALDKGIDVAVKVIRRLAGV